MITQGNIDIRKPIRQMQGLSLHVPCGTKVSIEKGSARFTKYL